MQKRASLNQRFNGVAAERFIKKAAPTGAIANSADDIISAVGNKLKLFGQEHGATMGKGALGIAGAAGTAKAYQALAKRYGVAQANKIMAGAVGGSAALGGAGYGAKKLFDAYGDDVAGYLASAGARAGALKDDVAGYLASAGARAGALKDMLKLPSTETLGIKALMGEELPNMLPAQLTGSALGAVGVGAGALGTAKAYQALAKRYGAARANKIMAGMAGVGALGGAAYRYGDEALGALMSPFVPNVVG
jgi:hypothetical protein